MTDDITKKIALAESLTLTVKAIKAEKGGTLDVIDKDGEHIAVGRGQHVEISYHEGSVLATRRPARPSRALVVTVIDMADGYEDIIEAVCKLFHVE
jgi:hypothetical protein